MKLLICLTDSQLTLVVREFRRVIQRIVIDYPVDADRLDEILRSLPASITIELVLDLLDEDRFVETVVRVMPWEQEKLLQRALKRRKGNDALLFARWGPNQKSDTGRPEKVAYAVCLANPEPLDKLLEHLERYNLALAHVYSLAELVAQACKERRRYKADEQFAEILVVQTAPRTYRQTLIINGIVRLSRQVQLPEGSEMSLASEVSGFERFVKVQRIVPFTQEFNYILVAWKDEDLQLLKQQCGLSDDVGCRTRLAAPAMDDPEQYLRDCPALALVQALVRKRPPASHYTPDIVLRTRKVRQTRSMLWGTSVLLILAVTLSGVTIGVRAMNQEPLLQQMQARQKNYESQARHYRGQSNLPVNARDLKDSTLFLEALKKQSLEPGLEVALVRVSEVLAQYPDFSLQRLNWQRPKMAELHKQQLWLELDMPADSGLPLKIISGQVKGLQQALEALPGVEKVSRSELPIEPDNTGELRINLKEPEAVEGRRQNYKFEVTVELSYAEPAS